MTTDMNAASVKAHIRDRYKGLDPESLEIIPATPQPNFYDDTSEKQVAIYARVSTDDPRQTTSYELQKNHYTDFVGRHPNWKLVDIYADEGRTGTTLRHRDSFNRMIADCKDGKIQLIITKSVSRFARNLVDCVDTIRSLAALNPPIGVFFESERLYTLNSTDEMALAVMATMAQEESHTKSNIMNASIEMRFSHGIFLTPPLLGYDKNQDGHLVINAEEARTVRFIFFLYLCGHSCAQIANMLNALRRRKKCNQTAWDGQAVLNVLQNERHCGAVLSRKTFTPSYLDHKSRKNRGDRNQYRLANDHEAIVSPDDFMAVQLLIRNSQYGHRGFLPELRVIASGSLRGFVGVHPHWRFSAEEYMNASQNAMEPTEDGDRHCVRINKGDIDWRGYEIARAQFFNVRSRLSVTFSLPLNKIGHKSFIFSLECVKKLHDALTVEVFINIGKKLLAVRSCASAGKHGFCWAVVRKNSIYARKIFCAAFLPVLFSLLSWSPEYRYRARGMFIANGEQGTLLFDLNEPEILATKLPMQEDVGNLAKKSSPKSVAAYPMAWLNSFGDNCYRHAQKTELLLPPKEDNAFSLEQTVCLNNQLQVTSHEDLLKNIEVLKESFAQEAGLPYGK